MRGLERKPWRYHDQHAKQHAEPVFPRSMRTEETKVRHCRPPLKKRGIRQRPGNPDISDLEPYPAASGRMSSNRIRHAEPARKARARRCLIVNLSVPGWGLLCSAELLEAVARGGQAGVELQRLSEIGNRAWLVAEPFLGLAAV